MNLHGKHPTLGKYTVFTDTPPKMAIYSHGLARIFVIDVSISDTLIVFNTGVDMSFDERNDGANLILHAIEKYLGVIGVAFDSFSAENTTAIAEDGVVSIRVGRK